ncbi:Troponin I [Eumeta japonica]|uniref:Troponin I n=1 Tax=Eumeta variegata TaxID=151549 RepID=A0A4C1X9L2_EUMVA|nr:Troponin I [Eumeta japonica]
MTSCHDQCVVVCVVCPDRESDDLQACDSTSISRLIVKPTLKKVSKYENKFAKLQKKAAEFNFRNQLKVVKKKEFTMEEEDKEIWEAPVSAGALPTHTPTTQTIAHYFIIL